MWTNISFDPKLEQFKKELNENKNLLETKR